MPVEDVKNKYYPALDQGWVRLVDSMGDDASILEAARTSYTNGQGSGQKKSSDRDLLRYLYRNLHTSPFEMVELKFHAKMPIFVARQWIRHRTACLAGGTELHFDLPGGVKRRGNQLTTKTLAEIFRQFQPTKNSRPDRQRDPFFKRSRVQGMLLRCVDEATGEVLHTHIRDIWESGVKETFAVTLETGATVTMSEDHLCFTDQGWMTLKELCPGLHGTSPTVVANLAFVGPGQGYPPREFNAIDPATECWAPVVGWEQLYQVSTQGRVRRIQPGKGAPKNATCKGRSDNGSGHAVVSLSRGGKTSTHQIHALMLEAFVGPAKAGQVCRHLNGNGLDNRLENLRWGSQQENAQDRVRDDATTKLAMTWKRVVSVTAAGPQMTYDIEVDGPWHNFSANGMIVHNSVNEMSGRYVEMPQEFYVPPIEQVKLQSRDNKQGRAESLSLEEAQQWLDQLEAQRAQVSGQYLGALKSGVAKELARIDLPLSTYTQWYWKIDLHNLLHFLSLRYDPHAQWEIRAYAEVMLGILKEVVPQAVEAWVDYRHCARSFSRLDLTLLDHFWKTGKSPTLELAKQIGMTGREWEEFQAKTSGVPEVPVITLPEPIPCPS